MHGSGGDRRSGYKGKLIIINVFGIKKNTEVVVLPRADYVMHEKDHLLVVGLTKDIDRLLASIK